MKKQFYITHDIDWISPMHPYSCIKSVTHGKKWINFTNIFNTHLFTNQIEALHRFNLLHDINSIWLVGAQSGHTYKRYGLRYSIRCRSYRRMLKQLSENGATIGLHSVMHEPIVKQVNALQQLTGNAIHFHRSHYLKFNPDHLYPALKQQRILTDFSLGKARQVSLAEQPTITHGINTVPTILSDNSFFFKPAEEVFMQFYQTVEQAVEKQMSIAVLFHPENFVIMPELWEYYQTCINFLKKLE
jgi:hypothetical protein